MLDRTGEAQSSSDHRRINDTIRFESCTRGFKLSRCLSPHWPTQQPFTKQTLSSVWGCYKQNISSHRALKLSCAVRDQRRIDSRGVHVKPPQTSFSCRLIMHARICRSGMRLSSGITCVKSGRRSNTPLNGSTQADFSCERSCNLGLLVVTDVRIRAAEHGSVSRPSICARLARSIHTKSTKLCVLVRAARLTMSGSCGSSRACNVHSKCP